MEHSKFIETEKTCNMSKHLADMAQFRNVPFSGQEQPQGEQLQGAASSEVQNDSTKLSFPTRFLQSSDTIAVDNTADTEESRLLSEKMEFVSKSGEFTDSPVKVVKLVLGKKEKFRHKDGHVPFSDQEPMDSSKLLNDSTNFPLPSRIHQNSGTTAKDRTDTEEYRTLTEKLMGLMESDGFVNNSGQYPPSPVKVDKVVFGSIEKLRNPEGSTLREIKKYLASNCDVNLNCIDQEIKKYIKNAVGNGVLTKKDGARYCITSKQYSVKAQRKKKVQCGKTKKPKRRKRKVLSDSSSSDEE